MRSNQIHFDDHGIFDVMARAFTLPAGQDDPYAASELDAPPAKPRQGFLERVDRWLWEQQQRAAEAYLAQSADLHDLEQRMRKLERGEAFVQD